MNRKIIEYLPPVLQDTRELAAIAEAEQIEIDGLWNLLDQALKDQFVDTASEYGVSRWEVILNITPKGTETLEDRKFKILTRLNEQLPYTFERLHQQLESLCGEKGYAMKLENQVYTLLVKVQLTAKNNFNEVGRLLKRVCPANMVIDLVLMYNQHETLSRYTHAQLGEFTHYDLRNEVLPDVW